MLIERVGELLVSRDELESVPSGVWRYRSFLPSLRPEDTVTLGEGATPLLHAERLGKEVGLRNLMVKDESRNPTGSFMDRGTTVLVSLAKGKGVRECSCHTTGNLGASLAAYCAKAGVSARIRVNPNTDQGKLYQMLAYGADLETREGIRSRATLQVDAANPYLLEGEKTTGFEILQDLGWKAPDVIIVPVGTGGHLSMIWRSVKELRDAGVIEGSGCRLLGVRLEEPAARYAPGRRIGTGSRFPLAELAESAPYFRKEADMAMEESGGASLDTTPEETIAATGLLAKTEGIFAEPSAASVVATVLKAARDGGIGRNETVVGVITGAGLKDTRAVSRIAKEARRIAPRLTYASPSPKIGETKLAMLRLLQKRPGYAYEMWRGLRVDRSISTASVYQHLQELEGLAFVRKRGSVVSSGRERILYELTKRGSDFLKVTSRLERVERDLA